MSINTSLEAIKHRQAKEIRDLRRKLRESRLILPPRQFRAVQSSSDYDDTEEDEEDEQDEQSVSAGDDRYDRVRHMILELVESGRRALETKPSDHVDKPTGAKVLHAEEVLYWRDSERRAPVSPTLVAMPDSSESDEDFESEDEVEAMISPSRPRKYNPPTVTITGSGSS
jgi:hypothetical protein